MQSPAWASNAFFYHIYPLGLCGAPRRNDFSQPPVARLDKIYGWLDHIQNLGVNALYIGPLFESSAHGYDTRDYYQVDRRLGTNETLKALSSELHRRGVRLVLDAVFNHVGRDFWAFNHLQTYREASEYASWFDNVDFSRTSPRGDPFSYEGWAGHYDLVKLNLDHPHVREHLFNAVTRWVEDFNIDGLRLDAADVISENFLSALARHGKNLRSEFWLMGEIVHGDYLRLANPDRLDSVTNYALYKALYSAHNDRNYFELAHSLDRMFGPGGIYRGLHLYNFADNHDVDRIASILKDPVHLYPLNVLLFTIPGIPSIYYGSEWGQSGKRTRSSDDALRPALDIPAGDATPHADLARAISRLAALREQLPALRYGEYQNLFIAPQQMAFLREHPTGSVVVVANAAASSVPVKLRLPVQTGRLVDYLNPGEQFRIIQGETTVAPLPGNWGRVMQLMPD